MVQTFMEVLNLTKINHKYVDRYVDILNLERIKNASKSGRGTILLTAHFGDWELLSLVSSVIGFPILVLVREQKMKRLNELLNRLRESNGCKVIRKGMQTKNILKALRGNNIVGILSDQDAGKNGMFVEFFGRPTSCHTGPFEIAKHTGSLILPNFIVRTGGPYHKVYLEEYIDFKATKSDDDIRQNLQKFFKILESYVRKYPDQWLWLHKRWKSTPVRTVLVLSDGKPGHLNQSLAVARQIQKARTTQGHRLEDTRIEVVEVKFKNGFSRTGLSACAFFATWRCHGCMRCMELCLKDSSYKALMRTYSDFVVSCGSSLAAANIFMSIENNAKNIVIMKPPSVLGLGKFDLAVIPKHDNPPARKNVVGTLLAPNLIDEQRLKDDGQRLVKKTGGSVKDAIGLFIGGDNPEFALTKDVIDKVIDGALKFCEGNDADIFVTTSRRTSKTVEKQLKDKLMHDPRCRILVIASENNFDGAVSGMLNMCKVHVVSEESVSMVSEAINSSRPVIAFRLDKKSRAVTKHERAMSHLEELGYLNISAPEDIYGALDKAWSKKPHVKKPDDTEKIYEAVRKLI
jgi:KDO2-lipid IV(A) lauroyltransferase